MPLKLLRAESQTPKPTNDNPKAASSGGAPFSDIETAVIRLSRQDRSLRGKVAGRFLIRLFGLNNRQEQADPRLEALRRMCVALHREKRLTGIDADYRFFAAEDQFLAAGYTLRHLRRLHGMIGVEAQPPHMPL